MPKNGTLRKRGRLYYYRFYLDGTQHEVSTGCTREREAHAKADELYEQATLVKDVPEGRQVGHLIGRFLERERQRVKSNTLTLSTYHEKERILTTHVVAYFGASTDITEIGVLDIEDYCADKQETLSSNSVVKHYHYINQFFKWCCKVDILIKNVADLADHPSRISSQVAKTLTAKEASTYLRMIRADTKAGKLHPAFEIAIHFALLGGMRRGESCGVRLSSLSFKSDLVYVLVENNITKAGNVIVEKCPKSGKSFTVVMPPQSTPIIKRRMTERLEAIMRFGADMVGDYIAGDDVFQSLNPDWLTRTHKRLIKRYGLPYVRFHDLRHTHATLLREDGVDIKDISDRLRHSTFSITADTYVHTNEEKSAEIARRIDRII